MKKQSNHKSMIMILPQQPWKARTALILLIHLFGRRMTSPYTTVAQETNYEGTKDTTCLNEDVQTNASELFLNTSESQSDEWSAKSAMFQETEWGKPQLVQAGKQSEGVRAVLEETHQYMANMVVPEPSLEMVRHTCTNHHALCSFWAATGERCYGGAEFHTIEYYKATIHSILMLHRVPLCSKGACDNNDEYSKHTNYIKLCFFNGSTFFWLYLICNQMQFL